MNFLAKNITPIKFSHLGNEIFCFAEGEGDCFDLAAFVHTHKLSMLGILTSSLWIMWLTSVTFLEDMTESEGRIFLPNGGSLSVPIWFSLVNFSRTSAIKKETLYSTLLNWDYQNFLTSSSNLPPWSARKNQIVYHVLIDGHTILNLTHSRIDSCHFIF